MVCSNIICTCFCLHRACFDLGKTFCTIFQSKNMTEEKTKPFKVEVDFLINAFSKPLTIAFVISLVFLILFILHRPNDNEVSESDSLLMPITSNTEVKVSSSL